MKKLSLDKIFKAKILAQKGKFEEAEKLYQFLLQTTPTNRLAQQGLAELYRTKKPASLEDTVNLVEFLYKRGEFGAVIDLAHAIIEQFPEAFIFGYILGNALKAQGKLEEAIEAYSKALVIKPDYADAYNNMGNALKDQDKLDEAIEAYSKALVIKPDYAKVYYNLGVTLRAQGKLTEAIEAYSKALTLKPDYPEVFNNMGLALKDQGKLDEAIEAYTKALTLKPDFAEVHNNLGRLHWLQQNFKSAFELLEWRWKANRAANIGTHFKSVKPTWNGEDNSQVFVWKEQGIGDEIMFSSTLKELNRISAKVIVECDMRLIPLYERSFPKEIRFIENRNDVPDIEYNSQIAIGSLLKHFRQNRDEFKQLSSGWLKADRRKSAAYRKRLQAEKNEKIIGISWFTKSTKPNADKRNLSLELLSDYLRYVPAKYVNLQYSVTADELSESSLKYGLTLHHIEGLDLFNDLDGLAALITACDVIISVDNATVHLAGALGIDTRVLLPRTADERWGLGSVYSYWYDSVRLYRQETNADWNDPLHRLITGVRDIHYFPTNRMARQDSAELHKAKKPTTIPVPSQEAVDRLLSRYKRGEFGAVVEEAKALTEQFPEAFFIWNILGSANQGLGRMQAASEAFERVTKLNPTYADGFKNLGVTLKYEGKLNEALEAYNKALSLRPNYPEAYNNIGNILKDQGKLDEAIEAYTKALSLKPEYAGAYFNISNVLREQGKLEEAIESCNKALTLKPNYAEAYYILGALLSNVGKPQKAIDAFTQALSFKPDYPEIHYNIGLALKVQGKRVEAVKAIRAALAIKPDFAKAHRALSSLVKYQSKDTQIALVNKIIKQSDLNDDDRCQLHYTLAKMNEDLGDLYAAYKNYAAGGKLRQNLLSYEPRKDLLIFDQTKKQAAELKKVSFNKPVKVADIVPIFIVGMPRSGTTLVEQIISSHSQVNGAGELRFMSRFARSLRLSNRNITSNNILQIRNAYLHELEKVSNGSSFVTDKMPHNFLNIALILKALPEAKIIHVKRNPAAVCWSNFKHYFDVMGLGYSYDLKDTVKYYTLYQDLMEFWDKQYSNIIYHLDYEKLVLNQELEIRNLIEHLELGWEYNCLSPQNNKRIVRTASQQQVRKKIYTGSSQAWRKFEPYLSSAFEELTDI